MHRATPEDADAVVATIAECAAGAPWVGNTRDVCDLHTDYKLPLVELVKLVGMVTGRLRSAGLVAA